ncbi:MAG: hypothetical protein NZ555_11400 [Geminicoccaceae bacterium]|nr:hypothetical protein [Geminicoccaceae bacterium]
MPSTYCFSVHTEATPSALPRVLEVFALMGHVPERCHSERVSGDELVVDLQLAELTAAEAAHLAKRLGRIVGVESVLWSARCKAA